MKNKAYIFNLETTKIELHFDKSEYNSLSSEQKNSLKSAFLWSRSGSCWVSRAKEPNLWNAKRVAEDLGFTEEQRSGERLTYAEQVERQTERAEARAERYEEYADNAVKRAEQLQKPINSMHGDTSFLHSRTSTRLLAGRLPTAEIKCLNSTTKALRNTARAIISKKKQMLHWQQRQNQSSATLHTLTAESRSAKRKSKRVRKPSWDMRKSCTPLKKARL